MINEIILSKVLEYAIDRAGQLLSERSFKLGPNDIEIEESLNYHLRLVKNWAKEVSFKDSNQAKSINNIYVNLDLSVIPRRKRLEGNDDVKIVEFKDLNLEKHVIILGQPGAGKTTSLKYWANKMLFEEEVPSNLATFNYPILIKFRELNYSKDEQFLFEELVKIFGVNIEYENPKRFENQKDELKKLYKEALYLYITKFIDSQKIVLLLDGFDELPNTDAKDNALESIRLLAESLDNSLIIMTSRSSDYEYHINGTEEFEIAPLNDSQIKIFSEKWLGDKQESEEFLKKVKASPFYDTTIRPLTIAHLCAIYIRRGDIPKKPKTIYKKLINLLLEEWDLQRSVKRSSQYADFEIDRKFEFLSYLSYDLTTYFNTSVFTSTQLERSYNRIHVDFGLPKHESKKVVNELESHTGLIIRSGYEQFIFAHKSLQEYFTANYLVKLPDFPRDLEKIKALPNEFAIAIAISSNSTEYFKKFVTDFATNPEISTAFLATFISRLILEKPDFSHTPSLIFKFTKLYEVYFEKLSQKAGSNGSKLIDIISPIESEPLGKVLINLGDLILDLVLRSDEFKNMLSKKYKIVESHEHHFIYRKVYECKGPKKIYFPNKKD